MPNVSSLPKYAYAETDNQKVARVSRNLKELLPLCVISNDAFLIDFLYKNGTFDFK